MRRVLSLSGAIKARRLLRHMKSAKKYAFVAVAALVGFFVYYFLGPGTLMEYDLHGESPFALYYRSTAQAFFYAISVLVTVRLLALLVDLTNIAIVPTCAFVFVVVSIAVDPLGFSIQRTISFVVLSIPFSITIYLVELLRVAFLRSRRQT